MEGESKDAAIEYDITIPVNSIGMISRNVGGIGHTSKRLFISIPNAEDGEESKRSSKKN